MTIEQIVRPFQSPTPLNTRRVIPSATKKAAETAGDAWGKSGTLPVAVESDADQPVPRPSFNTQKTREITDRNVEKSRVTENVRIENPADSSQYVMVERTKSIEFNKDKPPTLNESPQDKAYTAFKKATAGSIETEVVNPDGSRTLSAAPTPQKVQFVKSSFLLDPSATGGI